MKTWKKNNFGDLENITSLSDANNVDCKPFYFLLFKFSKTNKKFKCHFNKKNYIKCGFFSPTQLKICDLFFMTMLFLAINFDKIRTFS